MDGAAKQKARDGLRAGQIHEAKNFRLTEKNSKLEPWDPEGNSERRQNFGAGEKLLAAAKRKARTLSREHCSCAATATRRQIGERTQVEASGIWILTLLPSSRERTENHRAEKRRNSSTLSARSRKSKQKRGSSKKNTTQAETQDSSRQEINWPTSARRVKINSHKRDRKTQPEGTQIWRRKHRPFNITVKN
jgi:hypothetical protein